MSKDEMSKLLSETGDGLFMEYHEKFVDILTKAAPPESDGAQPLEVWTALAQTLADFSGYRVVLQAAITKPADDPNVLRDIPNALCVVGYREVASVDSNV